MCILQCCLFYLLLIFILVSFMPLHFFASFTQPFLLLFISMYLFHRFIFIKFTSLLILLYASPVPLFIPTIIFIQCVFQCLSVIIIIFVCLLTMFSSINNQSPFSLPIISFVFLILPLLLISLIFHPSPVPFPTHPRHGPKGPLSGSWRYE